MSPDDDRELPSLSPRHVAGPVFVSVLLHGALLYLLARTVAVSEAEGREERSFMSVSLVVRPPPIEPEVPEPEIPEPELVEADVGQPPAPQAPQAIAERAPAAEPQAEDALPDLAESVAPGAAESESLPWTAARIRSVLDTHARERRSTSTATWLTECILEQKEHGTRDCDRQLQEQDYASASMSAARAASEGAFASAMRRDRDWRMTERFARNNYALEALVEDGGIAGALATERILINNEYMRFLQGNVLGFQGQDPIWQGMNSGFTADVTGGPRLSLKGNIPFRCGGGKLRGGLAPGGAGVSDIVPCVFEFTGFTIEPPPPLEEPNAFRVVPVVPGSEGIQQSPANPITP